MNGKMQNYASFYVGKRCLYRVLKTLLPLLRLLRNGTVYMKLGWIPRGGRPTPGSLFSFSRLKEEKQRQDRAKIFYITGYAFCDPRSSPCRHTFSPSSGPSVSPYSANDCGGSSSRWSQLSALFKKIMPRKNPPRTRSPLRSEAFHV